LPPSVRWAPRCSDCSRRWNARARSARRDPRRSRVRAGRPHAGRPGYRDRAGRPAPGLPARSRQRCDAVRHRRLVGAPAGRRRRHVPGRRPGTDGQRLHPDLPHLASPARGQVPGRRSTSDHRWRPDRPHRPLRRRGSPPGRWESAGRACAQEHATNAYRHMWVYFVQKGWAYEKVAKQVTKPPRPEPRRRNIRRDLRQLIADTDQLYRAHLRTVMVGMGFDPHRIDTTDTASSA